MGLLDSGNQSSTSSSDCHSDNAGELKSQAMEDYIETIGAKDYFSVAYEQWQNGLAESSIGSLMLLTRSQIGLRWLSPAWVEDSGSEHGIGQGCS